MYQQGMYQWQRYEVQVVRSVVSAGNATQVTFPAIARDLFLQHAQGRDYESLWVLILDGSNRLLGVQELYRGTATSGTVRISEVFRMAVLFNASSIVVVHNHPSLDATFSSEDLELSKELIEAGNLLGIELLDSIVVGEVSRSARSFHPELWGEKELPTTELLATVEN